MKILKFNFVDQKIIFLNIQIKAAFLFKILRKRICLFNKIIFDIYKDPEYHSIINIMGKKIRVSHNLEYEEKKEMCEILKSNFWDADWYRKKYHPNFNEEQALDYWYKKWYWNNEIPSKFFNCDYVRYCNNLGKNPILYFLRNGSTRSFPNNCNPYKSKKDKDRIKEYLEYKQTRKAKGVIYTCITNDYDDIREIEIYGYIDKDWDYICFTDNKNDIKQAQIGIWEIRALQFNELDNTRNQRWHKTHPHLLFTQYEQSCWVDANINILSSKLFDDILKYNSKILITKHFKNTCIYQEYEDVLNSNLDDPNIIEQEKNLIKKDNMPINWGLPETNVLFRKHNDKQIMCFDEKWWSMIEMYSKRDQLSVSYIMWKFGFNIKDCLMENSRTKLYDFFVFAHKKGRG